MAVLAGVADADDAAVIHVHAARALDLQHIGVELAVNPEQRLAALAERAAGDLRPGRQGLALGPAGIAIDGNVVLSALLARAAELGLVIAGEAAGAAILCLDLDRREPLLEEAAGGLLVVGCQEAAFRQTSTQSSGVASMPIAIMRWLVSTRQEFSRAGIASAWRSWDQPGRMLGLTAVRGYRARPRPRMSAKSRPALPQCFPAVPGSPAAAPRRSGWRAIARPWRRLPGWISRPASPRRREHV